MNINQIAMEFNKALYGIDKKLQINMFNVDIFKDEARMGWRITDSNSTIVKIRIMHICKKSIIEYMSMNSLDDNLCRVAFTINSDLVNITIGGESRFDVKTVDGYFIYLYYFLLYKKHTEIHIWMKNGKIKLNIGVI